MDLHFETGIRCVSVSFYGRARLLIEFKDYQARVVVQDYC